MGVKAEVSNNYLEKQKEIHGHKAWQPPIWAIMSGDRREGSIGEAIHRDIVAGGGKVHSLLGDIRDPDTFFPLVNEGREHADHVPRRQPSGLVRRYP
jgi:hypothetical protein